MRKFDTKVQHLKYKVLKEVASFQGDISQFVPAFVADEVTKKIKERRSK
jgi:phosphopantetheine adenylyltransferase